MHFEIEHRTEYRYSQPVFLDPHLLRLRPRSDWRQRLDGFELDISPQPEGCARIVDLDGNDANRPWFAGTHDHLRIVVCSVVETLESDPYGYYLDANADGLPLTYGEELAGLAPYMSPETQEGPVLELARDLQRESENKTVRFLSLLNAKIRQLCPTETRLEGDPLTPEETLDRGRGACRDVTVLFMAVCRAAGLAARFTSGYVDGVLQEDRYLHAWAEVYLPGAGWRGYDPSLGLVVTDRHVALASGPRAAAARPFSGRFRGTGVEAQMTVDLKIRTAPVHEGASDVPAAGGIA
ncbi:MAG: transglutaminase family protein [Gemmatimonadetes bacterium]|jgi:transglutaminase-like putative cysteine protease|nr:transglutaminase family protein [Gemmatimonadota bacterium]MBT7859506.1 transglutaminase family protein [Gemmatimonadota bacterium]